MSKSLYIHTPFCSRKCIYCDFYSIPYTDRDAIDYVEILCRQIKRLDNTFSTIYIGGGTPTSLSFINLNKLLTSLKKITKKVEEFTIEANPESLDQDKIKLFLDKGVNRISIGLQALDDQKLKKLSRPHSSSEGRDAVYLSKKLGFKNISVDLIFGVWGESFKEWRKGLEQAAKLPITHISTYALTYPEESVLFKRSANGEINPLSESVVAKMYGYAIDYLKKMKFTHYEVSNFSKPGFACKHNMKYWDNDSYLGLGPAAVSYQGGIREKNIENLKKYKDKVKKGIRPVVSKERLSLVKRARETAALKIRTNEGIDFRWFKEKTGFNLQELEREGILELLAKGLVKHKIKKGKKTGVYLTRKGFLFCDLASSAFI